MVYVDVHAHLNYEGLIERIDEVIKNSIDNNVKVIITQGTEPKGNREVLELSKKYDIVKPALGFYPTHLVEYSDEEIEKELEFIRKTDCMAIGEVGLDYFQGRNHEHKDDLTQEVIDRMKLYFRKLVQISIDKNIPIIIHSRKAELDTIEILEDMKAKKVVMHCFCGKKKYIKRIIENKWSFSIPCNIKRAENFQYIADVCPIDKLFTETDAPFLAPTKETINEPMNVTFTVKEIARIKGMDEKEVMNNLYMNYMNLFL